MQTVFVGLSGGVDSAVSAYLLKKEGYNVVGAFIKVWEPDFLPCTSSQDRLDAMRVAAHLEIPFVTYDLADEYKQGVVDYFIDEYKKGRTPNPDVMCNREVKFGAFWEQAQKDGADMIATGHYAQIQKVKSSGLKVAGKIPTTHYRLLRGVDESKDQSYFLWTLTQDDLSHSLFPIGHLPKSEVRNIADSVGLPNAIKKDSQGLCFLGHVDMHEFLKHYIPVEVGVVHDTEGKEIGRHDGVWFYTIGQRLPVITGEKMFVVRKDLKKNILVVSAQKNDNNLAQTTWELSDIHWIRSKPQEGEVYEGETRYHGTRHSIRIAGNVITFEKPVLAAAGQSVVVYEPQSGECLGGGIIESHADNR